MGRGLNGSAGNVRARGWEIIKCAKEIRTWYGDVKVMGFPLFKGQAEVKCGRGSYIIVIGKLSLVI